MADDQLPAAAGYQDSESVTIVLVPPADPRTKPKACNYGLQFATGDFITIYDAEDLPEPLTDAVGIQLIYFPPGEYVRGAIHGHHQGLLSTHHRPQGLQILPPQGEGPAVPPLPGVPA